MQTVEATIDEKGSVRLLHNIVIRKPARALVTIMDGDETIMSGYETALLSESALAEDWNRPEEDIAWQHLQPAR